MCLCLLRYISVSFLSVSVPVLFRGFCFECRRLASVEADLLSLFCPNTAAAAAGGPSAAEAAVAAAAAQVRLGGYLNLSLHELSLLRPSCILRIFVEKRHAALLDLLSSGSSTQQQQQQQGGVHTLWEVAAACLKISKGSSSALVWRCLFGFCLSHLDWRGVALCVSKLPIHPDAACDPWGRLILRGSSSNSRKSLLLLHRIFGFLRRRREGGESVFIDELLQQQLARRGLYLQPAASAADAAAAVAGYTAFAAALNTPQQDTELALLLQRCARSGRLFRKQQQKQQQEEEAEGLDTELSLPVGRLSPLHVFVLRLCLTNGLPSLFLAYLEVMQPSVQETGTGFNVNG